MWIISLLRSRGLVVVQGFSPGTITFNTMLECSQIWISYKPKAKNTQYTVQKCREVPSPGLPPTVLLLWVFSPCFSCSLWCFSQSKCCICTWNMAFLVQFFSWQYHVVPLCAFTLLVYCTLVLTLTLVMDCYFIIWCSSVENCCICACNLAFLCCFSVGNTVFYLVVLSQC